MMDYKIQTFLSVCDTMSYTVSSENLHITQPAVTQHIQALENIYGCKLFTYKNKRLKKTKSAEILEQYARTMKVNEVNMIRRLQNADIKSLNIGATKTIGECIIGKLVEKFIAHDDNTLSLTVDNTKNLLTLIDDCVLDFALIEGQFDKNKYGHSLYKKEKFVGICSKNHPFASKDIDIEKLLAQTIICREEGSGTRAILENTLNDYNESINHFKRNICISSFPIILDLVKKGYGISFVYKVLAHHSGLSTFNIKGSCIQREFNFVYLKDTEAEEKIKKFIES